jgi:hypothetical protein
MTRCSIPLRPHTAARNRRFAAYLILRAAAQHL